MTTFIILFFFFNLCALSWVQDDLGFLPPDCLGNSLCLLVHSWIHSVIYWKPTSVCPNHQLELTFVSSVLLWLSTCHWWGSPHRRGSWRTSGWPAKASAWQQHPCHPQHGLSVQVVHTLQKEEREMWKSGCPLLLIPILSSSPNSHPFPGPESSLASILCPIPVPNPAVLDPSGNHSPDWRVFFWKEDRKDPKTNTLYH